MLTVVTEVFHGIIFLMKSP